jgi:hypothetical protein
LKVNSYVNMHAWILDSNIFKINFVVNVGKILRRKSD